SVLPGDSFEDHYGQLLVDDRVCLSTANLTDLANPPSDSPRAVTYRQEHHGVPASKKVVTAHRRSSLTAVGAGRGVSPHGLRTVRTLSPVEAECRSPRFGRHHVDQPEYSEKTSPQEPTTEPTALALPDERRHRAEQHDPDNP